MATTSTAGAAITFDVGHYYITDHDDRRIDQYDTAGAFVGSLTVPGTGEIHGLAFGDDGLLYATEVQVPGGHAVLAMDSNGIIKQTYANSSPIWGNIYYGKLAIDSQYVYTAGMALRRIDRQTGTTTTLYSAADVFDIELMPSGNLLVGVSYGVVEITPVGDQVRVFSGDLSDVRGLELDAASGTLFVGHLGNSSQVGGIAKIDYATGEWQDYVPFDDVGDLFLTSSNHLLAGNRFSSPRLFTTDLDHVLTLGTSERIFVTQMIPEPSAFVVPVVATLLVLRLRRARDRRATSG